MTSLQSAEAAVSSTERELSALDKLDATVTAKEAELAKIKADIATNAADSSGDFEEKARDVTRAPHRTRIPARKRPRIRQGSR